MATIRLFGKKQTYSDVEFVDGVYQESCKCDNASKVKVRRYENALYDHCRRYFEEHYNGVFITDPSIQPMDIFQEAFIQLWRNIQNRRIYVENGNLYGREGKPFTGKLTTYFMSIAKFKYLEFVRQSFPEILATDEYIQQWFEEIAVKITEDEEDENFKTMKFEVLAECMSQMPRRCFEILTKFYYEEKSLREIMVELGTYDSYDAIREANYRCRHNLRESANTMWQEYLNRGELVKTKKTKNKKNE